LLEVYDTVNVELTMVMTPPPQRFTPFTVMLGSK